MKTLVTFTTAKVYIILGFFMIFMMASAFASQSYAQVNQVASAQNGRIIKGIITDDSGPLESVNIVLKGTKTGTTTNSKGEFTFPTPLNSGDVLMISYLGYGTQEKTIKDDTSFLRVSLSENMIEFSGALNSDTPYKSKRTN